MPGSGAAAVGGRVIPSPQQLTVCSACHEPWADHHTAADVRWRASHGDEPLPAHGAPVELIDCITVLRTRHQP